MSNNTIIDFKEHTVKEFISIEHGTDVITITFFDGRVRVGDSDWTKEVVLEPDKAEALANEILKRVKLIKEQKEKEESP